MNNRNCQFKSIKQAMEHGKVRNYQFMTNYLGRRYITFNIAYFQPMRRPAGHYITAEWYDCSESYFDRFVRKHRNFR